MQRWRGLTDRNFEPNRVSIVREQRHEFPSPSTARGSCAIFADDQGATLHVAPAQHFDAIRQKL